MSEFTPDRCISCQKPIIWCATTKGNRMPVDYEPSASGNVSVEVRSGMDPLAKVLTVTQQFGRSNLRTSHFATCPQAAQYRRRGRS